MLPIYLTVSQDYSFTDFLCKNETSNHTLKKGKKVKNLKMLLKLANYNGFRTGGQIKKGCSWKPLVDKGFQIS